MGVSLTWLLHFMVECFTACPEHLHAQLPTQPTQVLLSRLEAEADAMWSFVQNKANQQWIWIAMDATSRQGSICVPGSYVSKSSRRAPNNAFPRRLTW